MKDAFQPLPACPAKGVRWARQRGRAYHGGLDFFRLPMPDSVLPANGFSPARALREQRIRIRGARTHNLRNIDVDIPRHQLVVITGVSGSGKSSLAFDTLYAEGQRRYVESLSTYARQFLGQLDKPEVDAIEGLAPAIAIEQKATSPNPRSTVGTVTEIHDHLRLLFARAGVPHCPQHGLPLQAHSVSEMVDALLAWPEGTRLMLLAPVVQGRKGTHAQLLDQLQAQGFVRFRMDGSVFNAGDLAPLDAQQAHDIEVVVDRLKIRADVAERLADSLEAALRLVPETGRVVALDMDSGQELALSNRFACPQCSATTPPLEPRLFSFNAPQGACPHCHGLGYVAAGADTETDAAPATEEAEGAEAPPAPTPGAAAQHPPCPACHGARLRPEALSVCVGSGEERRNIEQLTTCTLDAALDWSRSVLLEGNAAQIAAPILREISARLQFLTDVGLGYLNLARSAASLSGGEAQRIRLASQIGSGLSGVMYVLDEPSIGLHQRDNDRLIAMLQRLRDLGNSVIVVEHDADMMRCADHLIDMGPGAGVHGGRVLAQGSFAELAAHPDSVTGPYLSGARAIAVPQRRTPRLPAQAPGQVQVLRVEGACGHNLQDVDAEFPIGLLTCVTGVSGSGKSTLVNDTLYAAVAQALQRAGTAPAPHRALHGLAYLDKVVGVDQSPIGRTPRSNPATYTGLLGPLRELFAQTELARMRGYSAGRFSFNVPQAQGGGRCQACQGDGLLKVEMHFLPDVYVPCEACQGQRFNRETLEVQWKGRNIAQVLDMTVEEALAFFADQPALARRLQTLVDVGLSYLRLGQSATTLSGGEAQRIKLALELARRDTGRTLYILDEPTTGLHFADVQVLLHVLQRLRDAGNTLVVIEHNLDVIKTADWVIDIGPEGGSGGGRIVAQGTPEDVAAHPASHTGRYLQPYLQASRSGRAKQPKQTKAAPRRTAATQPATQPAAKQKT